MEIDIEKLKQHIAEGVKEIAGQKFLVTTETCIGTAKRGKIQIKVVVTQDEDEFAPVSAKHRCVINI